ncbi:MAG: peptidase BlaR1 [Acidobacteriales bacterium]|nr:peptidase BlaR1 [Terriglobales bacterium]
MYDLLLIAITLGSCFLLHTALSVTSLLFFSLRQQRLQRISPHRAAQTFFLLRVIPTFLTLIAAAALIVPAFVRFEPASTGEPVPIPLAVLASISLLVLLGALQRAFSAVIQSHRVMQAWTSKAVRQTSSVEGLELYRCQLESPVIAVLGLWRTRIFVSEAVFEVLTAEELDAALRHEAVHASSRDTLKKLLLHFAPKLLPGFDLLRPIQQSWAKACELAADEQAVCSDHGRTLPLASALVKVARISCGSELPTLSAALMNQGDFLLGHRVERLVEMSEGRSIVPTSSSAIAKQALLLSINVLLLTAAAYPQALSLTHEFLEVLVRGW